jgi:hypothetical protein
MKSKYLFGLLIISVLFNIIMLIVFFLKPNLSFMFGQERAPSNTEDVKEISDIEKQDVGEIQEGDIYMLTAVISDKGVEGEDLTSVVVNVYDVVKNQVVNSMPINTCVPQGEAYMSISKLSNKVDVWGVECEDKIAIFDEDKILYELNYSDLDSGLVPRFRLSPDMSLVAYATSDSSVLGLYNLETNQMTQHKFKIKYPDISIVSPSHFLDNERIVIFDAVPAGYLGNESIIYNVLSREIELVMAEFESGFDVRGVTKSSSIDTREVGDLIFSPVDGSNNHYFGQGEIITIYNPLEDKQSEIKITDSRLSEPFCISDYCNRVVKVSQNGRYLLIGNGPTEMFSGFDYALMDTITGLFVLTLEQAETPFLLNNNQLIWRYYDSEEDSLEPSNPKVNVYSIDNGETLEYNLDNISGRIIDYIVR